MVYVIVMLVIGSPSCFGYIRELLNNSSSSIVVHGVNWWREMATQDEQRWPLPKQPHSLEQEMTPQQRIERYARGLHDECSNYNVNNISYNAGYKKNMKCSGSS